MFSTQEQAFCPVGGNLLGYRSKKEISTFLCKDCGFLYTWNTKGVLLPPVKYTLEHTIDKCDCNGCQFREGKY